MANYTASHLALSPRLILSLPRSLLPLFSKHPTHRISCADRSYRVPALPRRALVFGVPFLVGGAMRMLLRNSNELCIYLAHEVGAR